MAIPTPIPSSSIDTTFRKTTNLASSSLNSTILSRSDDYFASVTNLLTPTPPIHKPGTFVHTGAWYDGWETRRHNPEPYDWAVIKLGIIGGGVVEGVEIDTAHFVGNYGEKVLVEGTYIDPLSSSTPSSPSSEEEDVTNPKFQHWTTILPLQPCGPSCRQAWKLAAPTKPLTHVRLRMYPDGGIARLRLYGHAIPPPPLTTTSGTQPLEELSSALLGGLVLSASDQHFTPASNILLPGRGVNMGDGWETARSRTPSHVDWVIIRLGLAGSIEKVVIDTKDFRGNFPRGVRVCGFPRQEEGREREPEVGDGGWVDVLGGEKGCVADAEHVFDARKGEIGLECQGRVFSHVMLTLVPDGGVKRFRVFGRRAL
ncbi:allantoicase [Polytolypa hystricis UAMH7299]|uniref:Allantoicase n=1 Tax=Polytolypa hystricis (strain UAMH7299) TaxID=1447883 RepID=A0A2B7X267_POLH7|nr:allantoicase [Polytolypa hystricis UAMH7299]